MRKDNCIPVVFCFDVNYVPYAAVSTYSLHLHSQSPLKIYWIIPSSGIDRIASFGEVLEKRGLAISVIPADESRFLEWKEVRHLSRGAYLRLLIPELVHESRAIYLDSDILVLADLAELYVTPLHASFLAGVSDPVGSRGSKIPRSVDDVYINSGVLLMNLDGLRRDGFFEKCKRIYSDHVDSVVWLDQCLINKYAENKKIIVAQKWNYPLYESMYDNGQLGRFGLPDDTRIVHFQGRIKPWMESCNPSVAEFWWQYAEKTGIPKPHLNATGTGGKSPGCAAGLPLRRYFKQVKKLKKRIVNLLFKRTG